MSTKANRYAHQLIDARARARLLPPFSTSEVLLLSDGYDIAKRVLDVSISQGEVPKGRKLGFTNRTLWPKYGVNEPIDALIWAHIFDSTVRFADDNRGIQSLEGALQPRIEPEIVFKLATTPDPDASINDLADCIEWMAHAFEIVVCPYPDWKFEAADAIAAFGLHGTLIIGEPHVLSTATRRNLGDILANASVSLSCCTDESVTLCGAGFGSDVLDSPLHAVWHLHQLLKTQPDFAPLTAGEIITTGTWTDAYPVQRGQTWVTAFSGVTLPGLTLSFV
ncbi:2-keto-4-pentenoate hydratase [Glaciimonas immobilis]|uniref:2-keto-4-pentenoate hydratase n=2 Tax=Glaciimonas immobilis TaxID=728004 RepID=A0A840RVS7_9BURK|nr:4-oxalocrotonate decarboxylase [Glaciimonas immobilis]MBB5200986.1 2-keto-4-pentenoate hydratase [Glaciimonas immobilis]